MNKIDFIWSGEVVSMIGREQKYHVKINCTGQLLEVIIPENRPEYRLGEKVLIQGHIIIDEIFKCNNMRDHQTNY